MQLMPADVQARLLACRRLPMLLARLDFELVGDLDLDEFDDPTLIRTLTGWQGALSLVASECSEDAHWTRSDQASLLAAACNGLTLYYDLRGSNRELAARVLDGVARSLDKAARIELMPPRWGTRAVVGLERP